MRRFTLIIVAGLCCMLVGCVPEGKERKAKHRAKSETGPAGRHEGGEKGPDAHGFGVEASKVWNRPPIFIVDDRLLPGAGDEPEYFVCRTQKEFDDLRARLGLPEAFENRDINFQDTIVVGCLDYAAAKQRNFRTFRIYDWPDRVEVQVISYPRQKLSEPISPCFFALCEVTDKPVEFFYNSEYAWVEGESAPAPGLHQEVMVRRTAYTVYVPERLATPAPMIVYLHGSTTTGAKNASKYFEGAEKHGFIVLAVTCANGYYWTPEFDYGPIFQAMSEVMAKYPVDPRRVYAGGGSAGGHTVYPFVAEYPDRFAAYFSVTGRLNPRYSDEFIAPLKDKPVFMLAGKEDELVGIQHVEATHERLTKLGAPVTLHVDEKGGHGLTKDRPELIEEIYRWLAAIDAQILRAEKQMK